MGMTKTQADAKVSESTEALDWNIIKQVKIIQVRRSTGSVVQGRFVCEWWACVCMCVYVYIDEHGCGGQRLTDIRPPSLLLSTLRHGISLNLETVK